MIINELELLISTLPHQFNHTTITEIDYNDDCYRADKSVVLQKRKRVLF